MRVTPREVALRILEELFAAPPAAAGPDERPEACTLAEFQAEGVARVRGMLHRRGGAVLADSVGLGKTYMALALIEETLRASGDAVVIVPASMRGIWRRALRRLPMAAGGRRLLSHTQLARGARIRPAPPDGHRLLVVDEAHRFRNPDSLRYAALARLVDTRTRVLLLTATPVNNRTEDLLHLIRLFAADDAFRDVGVPSLRDAFSGETGFDEAGHSGGGAGSTRLTAVVRATVVRRTRAMVRERFGDSTGPRFPARAAPRVIRYVDPSLPCLVTDLAELELAPYGPPRRDSSSPSEPGAAALVRMGLLKRLDSSPAAFQASLHRLTQILRATRDAAGAGRILAPGLTRPGRRQGDGDPLQLTLVELVARPAPPDVDLDGLTVSIERDLARVRRMGRLGALDSKFLALDGLLAATGDEKALVFTEFRDTADAIWHALRDRYRVGRVDGSGAWLGRHRAGRRAVVERFAPRANGRRPPPDRERVDVLIATDVLAEGLNLQDARHVVSYELPWNPVRLLQRIGRVDRLGSPHAEVVPYLFAPAEGLESVLGLTRRVRTKLGHIASTVGAEQADDLLERLVRPAARHPPAPASLANALERAESDPPDPVEELRTLWIRHRHTGGSWAGCQAAGPETPGRRDSHRPAAAAIAIPYDSIAARISWAVLVDQSGGRTLLEVDPRGAVAEAGDAARAAIAFALSGAGAAETASRIPLRPIQRYLTRAATSAAAPPGLSRHGPGSRLMRRLRGKMVRAGSGLDPGTVARADALLEHIAVPLDPTREANIRMLLERGEDAPIGTLLDAAETALAGHPGDRARRPSAGGAFTVLAALEIQRSQAPASG